MLLLVVLVDLLFLNPPVIILSTGDNPVIIGRWLGVVADDLAIGGDTRNGLMNRIVMFCKNLANLQLLMFPISVLYNAPDNKPHIAGVNV